jgi:dihydroorotate dehydrogenase
MLSLFHRFLLRLPPEFAHQLGMKLLKIYQRLICRCFEKTQEHLPAIHIKGTGQLKFPHRVGLAAGFDKNAEAFVALSRLGFGFVEVGTVTPKPQEGNPKPRLWRVGEAGLINQMGFNNCGVQKFRFNLQKLKKQCAVPVLANLGKNKATSNENAIKDYSLLFTELAPWVDGFVVNVSSPNTAGLRDLQSTAFLEQIESIAPSQPLWIKLAPDLERERLIELFDQVRASSRFSGCVLTNTSRTIALTEYQKTEGGYSGDKLFDRALEVVSLCAERFQGEKSIIGVGGVNSPRRAKQMIAAGASLIEVYTGFVYGGPLWLKKMVSECASSQDA